MNRHLHKIINRGIKEGDPIEVRRQIGLLNTAAICSFTMLSIFMVLNIYHQNWILLTNNLVLFGLTISLLFISRLHFFNVSVIVLCILFSGYFFADAVYFQNGLHYAILVMMVVSVLLIHSNTWRIIVLSMQISLFMGYLFFKDKPPVITPLPAYRIYLTVFCLLVIFALILQYFKRKQLQYIKTLSNLNTQLQESNEVKERMLSILSHDFNAPVANLVSTLNLVDAKLLTPQQFTDISARLQVQLNVLTTSLTDVLAWSKMQVSGAARNPANIQVNLLLGSIIDLFQYTLNEKKITVYNNVPVHFTAWADEAYLKIIFRNLLSNAIKFSNPGKAITINAATQDDVVSISVIDEGVGMQPVVLRALQGEQVNFASMPGTANERGTGLGLLLVREFLQKSNGTLTVYSQPGQGSTFTISLPVQHS